MQPKEQKTTDYTEYIIEREFLGSITVRELLVRILRTHFPSTARRETETL